MLLCNTYAIVECKTRLFTYARRLASSFEMYCVGNGPRPLSFIGIVFETLLFLTRRVNM